MIQLRHRPHYVVHELRNPGHVLEIDELNLIGYLVIIRVQSGPEKCDGNPEPRVVGVIASAVDPLRMSVRVPGEVELERLAARGVDLVYQVTQLSRQSPRSNQLQIIRSAAGNVVRTAASDHVNIDLRND